MQLRFKLSIAASVLLASSLQSDDYVSVQFLQYDESNGRTSVSTPSIEINKDFGTDYTLNVQGVYDSVSGASPTYYDASSGASAFSRSSNVSDADVKFGNVEYSEGRKAGSATLTTRMDNRDELKVGLSYSGESDFYSYEASTEYMHWMDSSKNRSMTFGLSYQMNEILVHCEPNADLSECDATSGASQKMTNNVFNLDVGMMQVVDKDSFVKGSLFYINEDGYLGSPYHNYVIDNGSDNTIRHEKRPDTRSAYGLTASYNRVLGEKTALQTKYRFYSDDWDIMSHTFDADIFREFGDLTVNLGLRYYTQSEANFYNGEKFTSQPEYGSSDQRLSAFDAIQYKLNFDYDISKDLNFNLGGAYYDQSTDLSAIYFVTGFTYKF